MKVQKKNKLGRANESAAVLNVTNRQSTRKQINLGIDFVPPDGGFGWLVVIAAGASNFFTFPILQQFGLLYADRLKAIGLMASEITTIINLNLCLTSCVGLINGPIFRRFSYRQVGIFAACLIVIAIYMSSMSYSFLTYLLSFSILYGIGIGINQSTNALVLNTYFQKKRRIATGLSWSLTGLGPIIMPQIIAIILPYYGFEGTILLYTGLALNALACALVFQPVQWHVKKLHSIEEKREQLKQIKCENCEVASQNKQRIFATEHMYNANITDWVIQHTKTGQKASMYSKRPLQFSLPPPADQEGAMRKSGVSAIEQDNSDEFGRRKSQNSNLTSPIMTTAPTVSTSNVSFRISIESLKQETNQRRSKSPSLTRETSTSIEIIPQKYPVGKTRNGLSSIRRNATFLNLNCSCSELHKHLIENRYFCNENDMIREKAEEERVNDEQKTYLNVWDKIVKYFDLDLLRDLSYVNLMVGVTLGAFTEQNFSTLTPFILTEWGLDKQQVATAMSLLGTMDVAMRFSVIFIAEKIGWDNKTFFLVGILGMALGRIIITFFHSYNSILIAFVWIGFGKGLRTVFLALVIPSYVPLNRLPAASGLQLLFAGIFYIVAGPVVGFIRDKTNYIVTLHCLNIPTFCVAICWTWEKVYWMRKEKRESEENTKDEKADE